MGRFFTAMIIKATMYEIVIIINILVALFKCEIFQPGLFSLFFLEPMYSNPIILVSYEFPYAKMQVWNQTNYCLKITSILTKKPVFFKEFN